MVMVITSIIRLESGGRLRPPYYLTINILFPMYRLYLNGPREGLSLDRLKTSNILNTMMEKN